MAIANLLLRFLLELCGIAAASWSGYQVAASAGPLQWVVAGGAALAVIIVWAVVVAPTTRNGLSAAQKDRIGTAIMLVTAASLALTGEPTLAIVFGAVIVLNAALLAVFGRDAFDHWKGMSA